MNDMDVYPQLRTWKEKSQGRPLRLLVCGLKGVGKSALVNRLLQLEDSEKWAEENTFGEATTSVVSKYERTTERGIKICLFDTPGFGDIHLSDEEIVAKMAKKTEGKLDLVLYCISLDHPARVQQADIDAMKILTQAFTADIWKRVVIVLTFANRLGELKHNADEYTAVIENISTTLKHAQVLLNNQEVISQLPIVTAGHTNPILKYEGDKSPQAWDDRLFLEILKRIDPSVLPALFEALWKGGTCELLIGGFIGAVAVVGAAKLGLIMWPVGLVGLAKVGAGGLVGGVCGAGMSLLSTEASRRRARIRFKMWMQKS